MPHVDDGTLHALLDGALRAHEPDRADRVEAHLDTCADCRARLEAAAALRDRASDVLADLDEGLAPGAADGRETGAAGAAGHEAGPTDGPREPVPDFQEVLARAAGSGDENALDPTGEPLPGGTTRGTRPDQDPGLRRRYAWTRGLAWAATIVVALGTGYLVRDLAGPTGVVPRAATTEASDRAAEPTAAEAVQADRLEADGAEPTTDEATDAAREGPAGRAQGAGSRPELRAPADESGAPTGLQPTAVAEPPATGQAEAARAGDREAVPEAEQAASGPEAADALAPPSAAAARGQADTTERGAETGWRTVAVEEAETRAGSLLVLPGATIAMAEVDDGSVRTVQQLPDSVVVVVMQRSVDVVAVQQEAPMAVSEEPVAEATAEAALRDQAGQQQLRLRAVEAMAPAEAVPTLLGLDLDSAAATVDAPVTVTVVRDGQSLTLTASLPEDVLLALAAIATPRTP